MAPDDGANSRRQIEREAIRLARLDASRIGQELRELRLSLGVRQADVSRVVGVTRSVICELEAGDPTVGLEIRRRTAIALGADLRVNVYPGATPVLHDAGHLRIIERILATRHRRWGAETEVRVPGPGRASTDVRLSADRVIVLIEVETHVRRWDAVVRRCFEKRERVRDALGEQRAVFAVLCLPPTRHHRLLVAEFQESVQAAFPTPPHDLRSALEDGTDWPGDGILWIAGGRD
jgi:HTH-type transcriptional regulator/antitoxin HipB